MGPTSQSNIPSATQQQQSTASAGTDVISELMNQAHQADEQAAQATRIANIPISGGHQAPQAAVTPGHPGWRMFDIDTSRVTGRHQATMQGISNAVKGVSNLVGQVDAMKAQKATQRLAVNMERLMGATQSMDQAKQVLAQDPNNVAAQDQLKRSNAIADEILSDDKVRKQISKAYNINFTDPSKNNTMEHAALKQATDSYSAQFQKQLPQNLAPNVMAQQQAALAQAQAAAVHKTVDAIVPAILKSQATLEAANVHAAAQDRATKARYDAALYTADQRYNAAVKGQNIHARAMLDAVRERDKTMLKIAQDKFDALSGVNGKSPKAIQEAQRSFDSITKTLNTYQQQINLLEQNRKHADSSQVDKYDKQIQFYESQSAVLQMKQQDLANKLSSAGANASTGQSSTQSAAGDTGTGSGNVPVAPLRKDDSDSDTIDKDIDDE